MMKCVMSMVERLKTTHAHIFIPPPDQMSASLISVGADVIPMQSMTLTAFGLRRDGKGRYGGSE